MPLLIGDVVICPEVAWRQAPEHTGSYDDELALLWYTAYCTFSAWTTRRTTKRPLWRRSSSSSSPPTTAGETGL